MKIGLFLSIIFFSCSSFQFQDINIITIEAKNSAEELELYDLLMDFRKSKGLPKIPLSKSLTFVAQQHCKDLINNKPDLKDNCNAHSWSKSDKWSSCCYTPDHKKGSCMWDKPKEMTNYQSNGFEIACGSSDPDFSDYEITAEDAIKCWKGSLGHKNVIINKGTWAEYKWKAIGIGIYKGYATVWFGKMEDPDGEPDK